MPSPTTDIQPRSHVTIEDIFAMEDDKRYEVIGGEIYVVPPPGSSHQELSGLLFGTLLHQVRAHGLGWIVASPVALILADDDYVEPDIVFVAEARIGIVTARGIEGVPDLVVEIQSKSTPHAAATRSPSTRSTSATRSLTTGSSTRSTAPWSPTRSATAATSARRRSRTRACSARRSSRALRSRSPRSGRGWVAESRRGRRGHRYQRRLSVPS